MINKVKICQNLKLIEIRYNYKYMYPVNNLIIIF